MTPILEDFPAADTTLPLGLVVRAYNDLRQRAHVLELALAMTTDPDADLDEPLGQACRVADPECDSCQ